MLQKELSVLFLLFQRWPPIFDRIDPGQDARDCSWCSKQSSLDAAEFVVLEFGRLQFKGRSVVVIVEFLKAEFIDDDPAVDLLGVSNGARQSEPRKDRRDCDICEVCHRRLHQNRKQQKQLHRIRSKKCPESQECVSLFLLIFVRASRLSGSRRDILSNLRYFERYRTHLFATLLHEFRNSFHQRRSTGI